jgi:HPt (histidine-containing phosphotransfer) domain-containing protein
MDRTPTGLSSGDRLSLVLVNDDPAQLMVQRRLLGKVADVSGYLSALEAVAAARGGKASPFLLTDYHMPDMDGPELARIWCELHQQARVLVVTASELCSRERDRFESLSQEAVKLVTSYRITDLQEHVQSWFWQGQDARVEPSSEQSARLDRAVLQKLGTVCGTEFARQTAARFLRGSAEKVEQIQAALEEGNIERIHQLSHSLRGSCGLVGAITLSALAYEIENATASDRQEVSDLPRLVQELVRESGATARELESLTL